MKVSITPFERDQALPGQRGSAGMQFSSTLEDSAYTRWQVCRQLCWTLWQKGMNLLGAQQDRLSEILKKLSFC